MTNTRIFEVFGIKYRTRQFAAVPSLDMLSRIDDLHPMDALAQTEINVNGEWVPLTTREAINEHLRDGIMYLAPVIVMRGIVSLVTEYSFAFAKEWKGMKVPARFTTGQSSSEIRSSPHVNPMIANIIQEGMATLRELEEYYSLEDAFKMFDVLTAKSINSALAHEAATKRR